MRSTPPSRNSESPLLRHLPTGQLANNRRIRPPIALVLSSQCSLFTLLLVPSLRLILRAICLIIFTSREVCWDSSIVCSLPYLVLFLFCVVMNLPIPIAYLVLPACYPARYFISPPSPIASVNNRIATQSCLFRIYSLLRSFSLALFYYSFEYSLSMSAPCSPYRRLSVYLFCFTSPR